MSDSHDPIADALDKLLRRVNSNGDVNMSTPLQREAMAEQLKGFAAEYDNMHTFQPGDLVKYKPGMKLTRFPEYGDPVVVMQMLAESISGRDLAKDNGSPYFCETYDMVIGAVDPDGEFAMFLANSRRYKPFA